MIINDWSQRFFMKRLSLFYILCISVFGNVVMAEDAMQNKLEKTPLFQDGKDYFSYRKGLDIEKPKDGRVLIQYFFKYECDVCLSADDYLKAYAARNKDKVILKRNPALENGDLFHSMLHQAFNSFGKAELSEQYLFDSAGRKGKTSLVNNDDAIKSWLQRHSIPLRAFNDTFHAMKESQAVKEDIAVYKKYAPPVIPMAILNGKYILTRTTLYNDDYTFAVLDFLVDKLQKEQQ